MCRFVHVVALGWWVVLGHDIGTIYVVLLVGYLVRVRLRCSVRLDCSVSASAECCLIVVVLFVSSGVVCLVLRISSCSCFFPVVAYHSSQCLLLLASCSVCVVRLCTQWVCLVRRFKVR